MILVVVCCGECLVLCVILSQMFLLFFSDILSFEQRQKTKNKQMSLPSPSSSSIPYSTSNRTYTFPVNTNDRILLDIGGVHYSTTLSTLRSVPHSYFDNMFNSELYGEPEKDSITGRYFVDRNGTLFQYILDFLRYKASLSSSSKGTMDKLQDGNFMLPVDRELRRRILVEANYFGLDMERSTESLESERREQRRLNLLWQSSGNTTSE